MRNTRLVLALFALATIAALPAMARNEADDRREAKKLFEAGLKLMKMDDFKAAAVNFEQSSALFPTQNSLFNLANCYRALQRYGDALAVLDRLQREFEKVLKPEIQKSAVRQESELRSLVGRLTVQVAPVDAKVSVDGKELSGGGVRGPLVLAPGTHTVDVVAPGYQAEQRTVQLFSGKEESMTVALQVAPTQAPAAVLAAGPQPLQPAGAAPADMSRSVDQTPAPKSGSKALRVVAWSALGAAVATGIAAGAFRLIANGHYSDFEKYNTGRPEDFSQRDAAKSDTQSANNLAIGLGITAAALAVTAGVTYLLGRESSQPATGEPSVSFSQTGLSVAF
jgi:hypothetical protein